MNAVQLLQQQNKLIEEQNRLLKTLVESGANATDLPRVEHKARRLMTEHDLLLIASSDNVLDALARWNEEVT